MKAMRLTITSIILFIFILLAGCKQPPTPNFQKLSRSGFPNDYLVCPPRYCNITPDAISPVYAVSATELFNHFNHLIAQESYTRFTYNIPEQGQFELNADFLLFGLSDDITVQFIAVSDTTSTLAIYSKSRYGFYDFGTNKRRALRWLQALALSSQSVSKQPSPADR